MLTSVMIWSEHSIFLGLRFHSSSRATSWRNCSEVSRVRSRPISSALSRPEAGSREISNALPSARTRRISCRPATPPN